MKIAASLGWYFPQSTGGTEVYVSSLYKHLQEFGAEIRIAAATDDSFEHHYKYQDLPVYRYPVSAKRDRAQTLGTRAHGGFEKFGQWLQEERADIYHQHSWTYGCGLHHLRAARQLSIPTVLTVHVPGPVCLRGTMLHEGQQPCDGVIRQQRCASCWLQERGLGPVARKLLSGLPPDIGRRARAFGRVGTALAATDLVRRHRDSLLQAADTADRVVAVCRWLYEALLANGFPRHKLILNRQGVSNVAPQASKPERPSRSLRIGYLGRWDPLKGIDKLVQAVLRLPASVPVELQIRAVEPNDPAMRAYMIDTCRVAKADSRIQILGPLPGDSVPRFLQNIDMLAVPSQWFETGPLVVLEAFSAGTPVIGSDLGGISELVRHRQNGWLVDPCDTAAWSSALHQLAENRDLVQRLQLGIGSVRTMRDVALETKQLYKQLLANAAS